jgi:uncharacterized repeat protein (TIGR03803 family)
MTHSRQQRNSVFAIGSPAAAMFIAIGFVMAFLAAQPAHCQAFTVLHAFSGGDGANPWAGLTMDRAGNFYGTTAFGGASGLCYQGLGCGTVFKLTHKASGWVINPLYSFRGGQDGAFPAARVIIGPDGNLYGTTAAGGQGTCQTTFDSGCGTVFKLSPPALACKSALCPWPETVLYRFTGGVDGASPTYGDLLFDQAGSLYGTAAYGGSSNCSNGCGVAFKLTPSNGGWTESTLYNFTGPDGATPFGGLTFDAAGNLYGTTESGGSYNYGTIYELTPSGGGWNETVLHSLTGVGGQDRTAGPYGGLIFDSKGNLFGTGEEVYGQVFELIPRSGGWIFQLLISLPGLLDNLGGPQASLIMDPSGNLYNTTYAGGNDYGGGTVFELAAPMWTQYILLHEFTGAADGSQPIGNVVRDANGNLFGTASSGGIHSYGVVFEITP